MVILIATQQIKTGFDKAASKSATEREGPVNN
jgi:hypothetical protein